MDKQVWKYELKTELNQIIEMPKGAEILTVQTQNGHPYLWALVDPEQPKEERHIEVFATGEPISYGMGIDRKYINSYQLRGGSFVFHVFEYLGF